jgi:hypothetical protein
MTLITTRSMNPLFLALRLTWVATLVCAPLWVSAAPLEVGSAWPTLTLNDQHDRPVLVDTTTQQVIFTAEKKISDLLSQVLGAEGKTTLTRASTVVVADISAMPAMISRLFAVPALRELPFSMALSREASTVADLPRRKGTATVLTLDKGRVTQVQFLQTEAELRQALNITP